MVLSINGVELTFFFSLLAQKISRGTPNLLTDSIVEQNTQPPPLCLLLCKNNKETMNALISLMEKEDFFYDIANTIDEAKALLREKK